MAGVMKNKSKYPGGTKPVAKMNVKRAGYDAKSEQGKQLGTAKPSTSGGLKGLARGIAGKLRNARG